MPVLLGQIQLLLPAEVSHDTAQERTGAAHRHTHLQSQNYVTIELNYYVKQNSTRIYSLKKVIFSSFASQVHFRDASIDRPVIRIGRFLI